MNSHRDSVGAGHDTLPQAKDVGQLLKPVAEVGEANETPTETPRNPDRSGDCYQRSFISETQSYITQYVQTADQKAVFLFTSAAAILAFLSHDGASGRWLKDPLTWTAMDFVTFVSMATLALAALASVSVSVPRLPADQRGLVSFLGIARFATATEYAEELAGTPDGALLTLRAKHCHVLAAVCRKKYRVLRLAVALEAIGISGAVVYFLLSPHSGTP